MRSDQNTGKIQAHFACKLKLSEGGIGMMNRWNVMTYVPKTLYDLLGEGCPKRPLAFLQEHGSEYSNNLGTGLHQFALVVDR